MTAFVRARAQVRRGALAWEVEAAGSGGESVRLAARRDLRQDPDRLVPDIRSALEPGVPNLA